VILSFAEQMKKHFFGFRVREFGYDYDIGWLLLIVDPAATALAQGGVRDK